MVKKIVVTGGSGFLGRAVVEDARERGHKAWSFDRKNGNDILGSLDDFRDADAVIHLAGVLGTSELFDMPETAVQVNVLGTLRVLQWCKNHDARYVGITMLPVFPSVYTATKVCAQSLATAWHKSYGVPVSHVRAFNAFGPYQPFGPGHPQKIIPAFSVNAWTNRPIPVWGDGEQTVDLIHVDDVARMLVDATDFGENELFEAGTGVEITVKEVAEFVLEHTGSTGGIEYLPMRKGEEPTNIVSTRLGWEHLDWQPIMDWSRLGETVDWYKSNV